ncbi:hypothetical protein OTK51_19040 [Vibrio scophthalmi]|uniref:hypothetical protein n=1 Tax=Vibrio scophthalmi TaxID=45658 RepID=UPI002284CF2C|nr:hypothetical protein [Vibrio scophthalmi]MCY9805523.1 hypothetical protein [Vibrio scophthalmi]
MADNFLPEEAVWEEGIRQVETTDVVIGGPGGIPNLAPGQLANRTKFLKEKLFDNGQFLEYNPDRKYKAGDVCYTLSNNEIQYWQWYSNVESLAGKSPLLEANRHVGWSDNTKPFYWVPYTGDQVGMPFYWLSTSAPEWAVMEINVNLPIAVYWRLARCYPHLVTGDYINTGEIRGEFLRVLDQGRGVNSGRVINSWEDHLVEEHYHELTNWSAISFAYGSGVTATNGAGGSGLVHNSSLGRYGGEETRPRNIARPMAIVI